MYKKLLFFIILLILPLSVLATEYHNNSEIIVPSDKIIETNYYAMGENISIYGQVNGDIFLIAKKVFVDSEKINGDLFIISQDVVINGNINGNIRVISEKLEIKGEVEKNTLFIGNIFNLLKESKINGNLSNFLSKASLWGEVNGKIDGYLESLFIDGKVNSDIDINFLKSFSNYVNFKIGKNAIISGNIKYKSFNEVEINEGSKINEIYYIKDSFPVKPLFTLDNLFKLIINFFGLMVVGMILLNLLPNLFNSVNKELLKFSFKRIIKGLLLFTIIPIISIILLITIIGIPLGIIILLLYGILIYLTKLFVAYFYFFFIKNKYLKEKHISNNNKLALGILIYLIISNIPFFGPVINILLFLLTWSIFLDKILNILRK